MGHPAEAGGRLGDSEATLSRAWVEEDGGRGQPGLGWEGETSGSHGQAFQEALGVLRLGTVRWHCQQLSKAVNTGVAGNQRKCGGEAGKAQDRDPEHCSWEGLGVSPRLLAGIICTCLHGAGLRGCWGETEACFPEDRNTGMCQEQCPELPEPCAWHVLCITWVHPPFSPVCSLLKMRSMKARS